MLTNVATPPVYQGMLPISAIEPSPTNPRKNFDPEKIRQLADTILAQGRILQKLLVRQWPGREGMFECVDGARRRLAALEIGMTELPVEVLQLSDAEVIEIQLITGDTGEPLSPLEEADGFQTALKLKDDKGAPCFTMRSLADKIGCAPVHIQQRVSLLRLPGAVRTLISEGTLAPRTANLLARIPGADELTRAIGDIVRPAHRSEPLTYKEAEAVIHERYMTSLRAAPFDVNDGTLNGPEGTPLACAACPLKSGNDVERFGDVKDKNVCTSPGCYRAKCNAVWDRTAAKALAAGQRVLTDEEAAEVFEKNSPTVTIGYSSAYVDVNAKPTYRHVSNDVEDRNLPTWREMIETAAEKQGIKVPVVLARDRTGKQWELVQVSLAIEAARAIGENMIKKVPAGESLNSKDRFDRDAVRTTVRGSDDFAKKKKAEADEAKRRLIECCVALTHLHARLVISLRWEVARNGTIFDAMFEPSLAHAGGDGQQLVSKWLELKLATGQPAADAVRAWAGKATPLQRHALIPILLIAQSLKWNGLKCAGFLGLATASELDVAAITAEAAEALKREKIGKKKPGKSESAPVTTDPAQLTQWVKARAGGMSDAEIARSYGVPMPDVVGALGNGDVKAKRGKKGETK